MIRSTLKDCAFVVCLLKNVLYWNHQFGRINRSVGMSGLVLISQKVNNVWSKIPERQRARCLSGKCRDWWRWEWNISGKGTDFISAMRRQACIADWQIARRWWICESEEDGEMAADSAGSLAKVNNGGETAKILKRTAGTAQQLRAKQKTDKKQRFFVFPAVLGGHFIGGRLHLKVEKKMQSAQWKELPLLCCQSLRPH